VTPTSLLAALLLVGGGAVLVLRSQVRRVDLRARLRIVDGVPSPSRRVVGPAVLAGAVMLAVPALPVVVLAVGAPVAAVVVAALVVLPLVATLGADLHAAVRRSGLPVRVPLATSWQRRLAGELVARVTAPFPAPPLRHRRPRRRSARPGLSAAGTGRRLLVVPPGAPPRRLWDVAEVYLGARSRYRDILSLNRGRRSPVGALITEDSTVETGWTLLLPRDATGSGLVDLASDPRLPMRPGPADRGFGGVAGASVVLTPPVEETAPADEGPGRAEQVDGADPGPDTAQEVGEPETSGTERPPSPLEHPPADIPWDLVHARLLAEGVRTTLQLRRDDRERRRTTGAGVRPLDAAAAAAATAAELGADRRGAASIDRALRALPSPPPPVVAARLLPDTVEFALAVPDTAPPAPFTAGADGRWWSLRRDVEIEPGGEPALPGLVSLGRDRAGWTMLDLAGTVSVLAGEVRAARMVATAIGLELLTSRWSTGSHVTMVGFGRAFAGLDPRLSVVDRLDHVLGDVVRRAGDGATAHFLVLAAPPPAAADELLRRLLATEAGRRLGVLVVGGATEGRRVLHLDADGVLTCAEPDLAVGAQALSASTAAALARLVAAETGSRPPDPAAVGGPAPPDLARTVDPDGVAVVVRLFGEPGLEGPDGPLATDPVTVEIVAFLALRGIAAPDEIARAVFPFGVPEADLRMAVKVVVEVLATAGDGEAGVLEYEDGRLELTPDVQADWHLFVRLAADGQPARALELPGRAAAARGAPGGVLPFAWMHGEPLARSLPGHVADVAHAQVDHLLAENRLDLAVVAATAGLHVQPPSGVLREDLRRALRALGDRGLVR
jgi:hypothetical protein